MLPSLWPVLDHVEAKVQFDSGIHFIMDNNPTYIVKMIANLTDKQIWRGVYRSTGELAWPITEYTETVNEATKAAPVIQDCG